MKRRPAVGDASSSRVTRFALGAPAIGSDWPFLPAPGLLVTVTGVLELLAAAALLWSRTAGWSALGLTAMLVAMFPANVHKALNGPVSWGDQLVPRTLMQVVFLAATITVAWHYRHTSKRSLVQRA